MGFLDQFTQKHIHDVLKRTFSYSDECNISFFVDKCGKNSAGLNVKRNGIEQKYVLVKIPKNFETEHLQNYSNQSNLLHPVFIIENVNKEWYGAFQCFHGTEYFILPEHNSTQYLKIILRNLAKHQASNLINIEEIKNATGYGLILNDITRAVASLDPFRALDKATAKQSIENLQLSVEKLFNNSSLLVRSIWLPIANNVYISQDRQDSIFLTVPLKKIVPPAHDALLFIFSLSNEKFRQEHFDKLLLHYFHSLRKSLQMLQNSSFNKITRSYSEYQVKVLLPVVKFEIVGSLLKLENSLQLSEVATNLLRFLKYPLINQEDIDEAIKNQIGSNRYELLDFMLIPLSHKNGHLGEYFHLGIKIKVEEKERELKLFAKFLITSTEEMERVLKSGPSKKEDYFYKILIPLFADHGLESLLDFAPRCHLSRIDVLLILDDLSQQGYVGFKPNAILNYEGLRAIVEQLAKFHACTIILEEILSEKSGKTERMDNDYGEFLEETMLIYDDDHHLKQRYDATLKVMYHIVEKFPGVTKKLNLSPQEIRSRLKNFFLSIFSKVKKSNTIRNVISHGDVVVANMMFKFNENNLISQGILVDFQMLRYVTPSYDLLVFIIANSTKETRRKYLNQLIEHYYQYISDNIRKFNYDPETILPKKSFEEDIDFMMSAAVMGAFMCAHILHIDPDFREEISHDQEKFDYYFNKHRDELVDLSWKSKHYRNILKGLVEDMVDVIKKDF